MTMSRVPVAIASKDHVLKESLLQLLKEEGLEGAAYAETEAALAYLQRYGPGILLLDTEMAVSSVANLVAQVKNGQPRSQVICITQAGQSEMARVLQRQGAAACVAKPLDDIEMIRTLQRVGGQKTDLAAATAFLQPNTGARGKIITFFSTISGAGKTVLAINLAAALANQDVGKICLVDANLQFGDIGSYLRHEGEVSIASYAAAFSEGVSVQAYLSPWKPNVDLLLAPERIKEAELVTPVILTAALRELSHTYDYVLVDTTAGFNEWTLSAMDLAQTVFFVNTVEHVPAVRKVRIGLNLLQGLGYGQERIRLLLNRDKSKSGLDVRQVETALERKFQMHITNDYDTVVHSVLNGIPFVESQPDRLVSKQLELLAMSLQGQVQEAEEPRSWLSRKLASWF